MSMKNSSDPTGNRSHLQVLNFVLDRQVKNMENLRVLQKGQYLKCDPTKSWGITVTEIYMLTLYATVFYTSFGPVIFMQVSSLEKERDTVTNQYY
jgi:hypothetical protein